MLVLTNSLLEVNEVLCYIAKNNNYNNYYYYYYIIIINYYNNPWMFSAVLQFRFVYDWSESFVCGCCENRLLMLIKCSHRLQSQN